MSTVEVRLDGGPNDSFSDIVDFLSALPDDEKAQMMQDIGHVCINESFNSFIETLGDWCATGEVYANPGLKEELEKAIK